MRRKQFAFSTFALAITCVSIVAADLPTEEPSQPIPATRILEEVRARLPHAPLDIHGELHVRRLRGIPVTNLVFTMHLNWGQTPAHASYEIRSNDGTLLEKMRVTRTHGGHAAYERIGEDNITPIAPDALQIPIQKTDLSWLDLTLDFLWWPNVEYVGEEEVRGRPSLVLDLTPLPSDGYNRYKRVRVWIWKEAYVLLQAQGYDKSDELMRELWVRSFKKIDERWMIKDLEVQSRGSGHRTKLRISDVIEGKSTLDNE